MENVQADFHFSRRYYCRGRYILGQNGRLLEGRDRGWWMKDFSRVEKIGVLVISLFIVVWVPTVIDGFLEHRAKMNYAIDKYFRPESLSIGSAVEGQPVYLDFKRTILQPFRGRYTVEVRTFPERTIVCTAGDDLTYRPDNVLPEDITLSWWTNDGTCNSDILGPGEYVVTTRWDMLDIPERARPQFAVLHSNPFEISPKPMQDALERQQQLERELQQVTRGLKAIQKRLKE